MAAPGKVVRATVARGRTVVIEGKSYRPGQEVALPEAEIARFRTLGFLLDPQAPEIPVGDGPNFGQEAGRITAA